MSLWLLRRKCVVYGIPLTHPRGTCCNATNGVYISSQRMLRISPDYDSKMRMLLDDSINLAIIYVGGWCVFWFRDRPSWIY